MCPQVSELVLEVSNQRHLVSTPMNACSICTHHLASLNHEPNSICLVDQSVNKTQAENPGPGTYPVPKKNLRYKNAPSWGLGSGKRSDLGASTSRAIPGPGVYDLPSTVGTGPRTSMGMRTSHDSIFTKSDVPGPGTYQPAMTSRGARFTLKGRNKIGT